MDVNNYSKYLDDIEDHLQTIAPHNVMCDVYALNSI